MNLEEQHQKLFYHPLAKYVRECHIRIDQPEREDFSLYPVNPFTDFEPQCSLQLSLVHKYTEQVELFDFEKVHFFTFIHTKNIFKFAGRIVNLQSSLRTGQFLTSELKFRSFYFHHERKENPEEPMQMLLGSNSPDPEWMHKYVEGTVQMQISFEGGNILL